VLQGWMWNQFISRYSSQTGWASDTMQAECEHIITGTNKSFTVSIITVFTGGVAVRVEHHLHIDSGTSSSLQRYIRRGILPMLCILLTPLQLCAQIHTHYSAMQSGSILAYFQDADNVYAPANWTGLRTECYQQPHSNHGATPSHAREGVTPRVFLASSSGLLAAYVWG